MIEFRQRRLENGLTVIVHEDSSTEIAAFNILYKVGSKDEQEEKTGFAHLFEHLMFAGSANVTDFDAALQKVGGESNAFTSPDITNYYITLPATNLESAFWLESDRMLSLNINPLSLDVQRKVVVEEFKQRYLNQPYGDAWLKLRPLAYKKHNYKWATIGKDVSHIENATLQDVKEFFDAYYTPQNAILTVAGNVKTSEVIALAEKWFGTIPGGGEIKRNGASEPAQTEERRLIIEAKVPLKAIYKTFHMPGRFSPGYYGCDLLNDILGRGASSRFYSKLVKEKRLFNSINAYNTGSIDPGMFVITGKLNDEASFEECEKAINDIIEEVQNSRIKEGELMKVKNQAEATLAFSEVDVLNRAMNLSYFALSGDPGKINEEATQIQAVTPEKVQEMSKTILNSQNCSTLLYHPLKT